MDARLPREERIRQRAEYLHIQGRGRKFPTPNFICFGVLREGTQPARLGITVSRRVGGAVVRNRVKRLVREAYRRQKAAFPAGTELVVIARPEAATVSYAAVCADLHELGRRIRSGVARSRPQ